jgi:hypothetical protein
MSGKISTIVGAMLASGMLGDMLVPVADNEDRFDKPRHKTKNYIQTATSTTALHHDYNSQVETRQVRRQRERQAAKD